MKIKVKLTMKIDSNIYTFLNILVSQGGKFFQFSKKNNIIRVAMPSAHPDSTLGLTGPNIQYLPLLLIYLLGLLVFAGLIIMPNNPRKIRYFIIIF